MKKLLIFFTLSFVIADEIDITKYLNLHNQCVGENNMTACVGLSSLIYIDANNSNTDLELFYLQKPCENGGIDAKFACNQIATIYSLKYFNSNDKFNKYYLEMAKFYYQKVCDIELKNKTEPFSCEIVKNIDKKLPPFDK